MRLYFFLLLNFCLVLSVWGQLLSKLTGGPSKLPFLGGGGGGGGPNPMQMIKQFVKCPDGEEPETLICREDPDDEDDEESDESPESVEFSDTEDFDEEDDDYLPWSEPLPCFPEKYTCTNDPDDVEPREVKLPSFLATKLGNILKRVGGRLMRKITKICEGEDPEVCECSDPFSANITRQDIDDDPSVLVSCKPQRCLCENATEWTTVHPGRAIKEQLLISICHGPPNAKRILGGEDLEGPIKCKCEDESEIPAPFRIRDLKNCKPQSCTCLDDDNAEKTVNVDFDDIFEKHKNLKKRFKRLGKICDGEEPTKCSCTSTEEGAPEFIEPPLEITDADSVLNVLACFPDSCTCPADENGVEREVALRPKKPFEELTKICPQGENGFQPKPESCTCEDGTTQNLKPEMESAESESDEGDNDDDDDDNDFDGLRKKLRKLKKHFRNLFKKCKPTKCMCPGGEEIKMTFLGCKEGGVPSCRTATGSRRERRKMTCDNGDQIKKMKVIRALLQNKCVCPDNSLPKCNDGEPPKCPITDEAPDPNLSGSVIDILSRCNP